MTRAELIEALASGQSLTEYSTIQGFGFSSASEQRNDVAKACLAAMCEAVPGLSDVIDGKAVIVPQHATGEMLEAGKKAWRKPRMHVSHQASDDLNTCGVIFAAMIAARLK